MKFTPPQALMELTLLNAETSDERFEDFFVDGVGLGLPVEVLTRLKDLWGQTKRIGGEIVAIGKIIVQKIFEFLKANLNLMVGFAMGAAVGALVVGIPFIGPLLAPLSMLLGGLYGAGTCSATEKGIYAGSPFTAAMVLAEKFFELLRAIFIGVSQYLNVDRHGNATVSV